MGGRGSVPEGAAGPALRCGAGRFGHCFRYGGHAGHCFRYGR